MTKKMRISFAEVSSPISGLVTKFGGQPDWVTQPQWPLSKETGNPMRFICQIKLEKELFPETAAEMAYLFLTEEEDGNFVDSTYAPDGGENAVILQPGSTTVPTRQITNGPTLYKMQEGGKLLVPKPCGFAVTLTADEDANPTTDELTENKIGGNPAFLQGEEFPFEKPCHLVIQLDSCSVPFYVNFGDAGVGYAFLNSAGDQAKFLWQCC